ncbi:clathrin-coated vesicle protein [Armillaria luteobubalina]|uniref:Clathrin-coated vesicle protein n=1 Tax=Armillaria luteobubalina TaxID=153913 RepID=A0AA39Q4Z1_9AGAR|nr:clathrin-coated vesicle protein [Armillaria luteobubalina]
MSTEDGVIIEDIQETEITEEHGEMYVFQWIASMEKKIAEAPLSTLKAKQADIEVTLVKIITAPSPFPAPGRGIRNVVARCLVSLYTRSETRTLFDTIQAFLKIVGDSKTADKDTRRIAALYCIGEVMLAFGSQFMSFMAEIATVTLRLSKSSSNSPLLRYHAILALQKSLSSAKRAVADNTVKDIIKQMRSALVDRCHPVQRASAEVLIVMYSGDDHPSTSDIDTIIALSVRSLEHADHATRRSLSQLVGHLLASTQTPRVVPSSEPPVKKSGAELLDTEDTSAGHAAASEVTKPLLTPTEMLSHLSTQYNKPNLSRKCRIGLFDFYAALFIKLGGAFTEANYSLIVSHLMTEIVSSQRSGGSRYEVLLVRRLVEILLRDLIGVRMLSEQGQIGAIQELASSYLKRWPALMPGQTAPSSMVLAIVLREVAGLLQQLGNAPPPVQDAVAEPLVTLLAHPSYTIRVNASWTLRCFCSSTPLRLPKTIITVFELLQRDMTTILSPAAPSDINPRSLGHAYGLSALVSIIPERPLYVSYDVSAKVLDMAIQLLKHSAEHDVKIAGIEVEVAWTLIASLMSLGPNFVRAHLQQLLVLWRNALPKPTSKDAVDNTTRPLDEWMFLFHLRESALGAILSFLKHNSATLVTLDVGRRIAMVLSNALLFANNFINQKVDDGTDAQIPSPQPKGLTLKGREALLRRRVYGCFTALGFSNIPDATQTTLLQSAVTLFASADGYAGSSVQAAIASSSGTFTSVWNSVDGYAYGVTFTEMVDHGDLGPHSESTSEGKDQLNRDSIEASIDSLLRKPIFGAREHDKLTLCRTQVAGEAEQEPPPPATAIVDAAIDLFARLLPLQDTASTVRTITQLLEAIRSPRLEKNAGRKAAVTINAATALALTLRNATTSHYRQARDTFGSGQVTNLLSPFLKDTLVDGDHVLRSATSECIGRLASLGGTNFLTNQIKQLVDQVVSNRDPYARAGCALAFGAVYTHVGGLAAGPLLKTTVNVLMSLSNDPHPLVHFWALNALARVINAASLAYAPFVSSTLGMLLKIYLMDSHECEGGSLSNANLSGNYPAYPVVCQIIDAVITVLGPDIQESSKTRVLLLNLVHEFSLEMDEGIRVEAIKCFQHFLMFAPEHVDIPDLVNHFRSYLSSTCRPLKVASINALYQLVQKDALAMSKLGGDQLVENLFSMLDDDASVEGVRSVITSWLHQTVVYNPSAWIDLCQRIMSRTTASQRVADAATGQNMRDDEGESLSVGMAQDGGDGTRTHLTSRWRTQLFALQCLHQICSIVAESGRKEHVDIVFARTQGIPTSSLLISRVTDLIKMAFTASTAYVTEIRMEGLVVLRDVIQIFATSPDPAFEDSLLLEQHQAPITAALTPAFSADSTPEILASAVQACAVFVGCGVVKDVNRMGRILKLLTTALEQSKDSGMVKLGETAELSPNASAMLRISTLSAWAELEVSSTRQSYLKNVVDPYRASLATLWLVSLRDYASIRTDSEFLHDTSSVALDSTYSSLGKEVLLPYYAQSWSLILQAVATAMQANDPHILAAMHGREGGDAGPATVNGNGHEEPSALFFVIFGLAYEALVSSADSNIMSSTQQSAVLSALMVLKCLVLPQYAGKAIMEPIIFDEFIAVCYRMAMTETASIQTHLIEVLSVFALSQEVSADSSLDMLSANSPKAHCLKTCAYILRHTTSASRGPIIQGDIADRIKMITACFSAFGSIAASLNTSQREDIRGVAILLYSEMLKDESSEIDLVGPTLPCLKALLDLPTSAARDSKDRYGRLVHGLISACLLNVDGMRGRQGFISTKKVKNNLLAAVLILTVIPPTVKVGRAVLEHACFLISQKLLDADEASLTAAHCAKTLMIASTSGNPVLRQCAKLLVPSLIEYIAKMAPLANDGSITETHAVAIGEVWKAFSSFFASVAEEHRSRLLGVILPTITLLLTNTEASPSPVVTQSIAQLLSYATSSPAAFKDAAGKLEPSSRELLEQSVRRAIGGNATSATAANAAKPQISLRSF